MNLRNFLSLVIAVVAAVAFVSCREKQSPDEMTVMSYNIRLGVADDGDNSWENRKDAAVAMLCGQMPDIFGVQEAYQFQADYITDCIPQYKWVGVGREDGGLNGNVSGEIMAIFYNSDKIDLDRWGTYWLSETPDTVSKGWDAACRRTATWALLKHKVSGKPFYYVNTHLDHVGRLAQHNGLQLVVDSIKAMNPEGYPMVLTGDFNVQPCDSVLIDIDKLMLSARREAPETDTLETYHDWNYNSHYVIDHIYYSGFKNCLKFKVLRNKYLGRDVSDHYPVVAVLVF